MNGPLLAIERVSKEFDSRGKRVLAVDSVFGLFGWAPLSEPGDPR
jgi:hypothetical protein